MDCENPGPWSRTQLPTPSLFYINDILQHVPGTEDARTPRPYRFGYGYLDKNQNYQVDSGEKKVYFEFSDYSTNYLFYESPL